MKELKGTRTEANLMEAFAGESQARNKYTYYASQAKKDGYKVFVLSNASDLFYVYFPKFLPLSFFDGVFVSSDYLMLKPDIEIYNAFLEKYGLVADECMFVDDREENVEGARKAGMNGFVFKGDYDAVFESLK